MNREKIAVLTAMDKVITEELKKEKTDARYEMAELYAEYGTSQVELNLLGEKVGTVSFTPPKPDIDLDPESRQTALEWMYENGLAEIKPITGWKDHISKVGESYVHVDSGEVLPWIVETMKPSVSTVRLLPCFNKDPIVLIHRANALTGGIAGYLEE